MIHVTGIKDAKAAAVAFPGSGAGWKPSTPHSMCFAVERGDEGM